MFQRAAGTCRIAKWVGRTRDKLKAVWNPAQHHLKPRGARRHLDHECHSGACAASGRWGCGIGLAVGGKWCAEFWGSRGLAWSNGAGWIIRGGWQIILFLESRKDPERVVFLVASSWGWENEKNFFSVGYPASLSWLNAPVAGFFLGMIRDQ